MANEWLQHIELESRIHGGAHIFVKINWTIVNTGFMLQLKRCYLNTHNTGMNISRHKLMNFDYEMR